MKYIEVMGKDQLFQIRTKEWNHQIWFHFDGRTFVLDKKELTPSASAKPQIGLLSVATEKTRSSQIEKFILSPIPGQIMKIPVQSGTTAKENQTLLILSSMKMEYTVKAPQAGIVKSVKVKEGEMVSAHQKLIEMHFE